MSSSEPWAHVERRLLDQVFHQWSEQDVRDSADLARAGMIDSLSVVAALEVLVEATDDDGVLTEATPADFATLGTIRSLYTRVTARAAT
jgi:hypothetical protein